VGSAGVLKLGFHEQRVHGPIGHNTFGVQLIKVSHRGQHHGRAVRGVGDAGGSAQRQVVH
jgi:hypothetical protein